MLRITLEERPETTQIKIEGRLSGPYVDELERTWRALQPGLNGKQLSVDLCGMTGVDESGRRLLAEMYSKNHAQFIARSVLTEFYAEQARQIGRSKVNPGATKCVPRTLVN
jgi:ABC-type transporter Mla MlaB component